MAFYNVHEPLPDSYIQHLRTKVSLRNNSSQLLRSSLEVIHEFIITEVVHTRVCYN